MQARRHFSPARRSPSHGPSIVLSWASLVSIATQRPQPVHPPRADGRAEGSDLRATVWKVLSALEPNGNRIERRDRRRYPYPYLVHLTPVGDDGVTPQGETLVVVGKHLSEQGLGFYHSGPLPYRRMIASFESSDGTRLGLLLDVTWCRFLKQGWYESGGRFLQAALPPLDG